MDVDLLLDVSYWQQMQLYSVQQPQSLKHGQHGKQLKHLLKTKEGGSTHGEAIGSEDAPVRHDHPAGMVSRTVGVYNTRPSARCRSSQRIGHHLGEFLHHLQTHEAQPPWHQATHSFCFIPL